MNLRLICYAVILLGLSACGVNAAERNTTGGNLYDQGLFDEALRAYQMAQVIAPDAPELYFNGAITFAQIGELEEAVAALNQTLKTADDDLKAKAYYNLGNVYFEMSLFSQAVESYQQSLLRNPEDNDARYNLELALNKLTPPSATPRPQPQKPDSQATSTTTPGDEANQTPTSLPESASTPQPNTEEPPASNPTESESTMTIEEASRLLDSIQQDQGTLRDKLQTPANAETQPEKDW